MLWWPCPGRAAETGGGQPTPRGVVLCAVLERPVETPGEVGRYCCQRACCVVSSRPRVGLSLCGRDVEVLPGLAQLGGGGPRLYPEGGVPHRVAGPVLMRGCVSGRVVVVGKVGGEYRV